MPAPLREVGLALAARGRVPALGPGPPPGPVLVIAPHPDDETIGPGGTLARHADAGDDVVVLVATSGESTRGGTGDVAAAREAECRAACAALGLPTPRFAQLPDGGLQDAVAALARLIAAHGAEAATVYVPSLLDPHPDHRAVNAALALTGLRAEVLGYEVWAAGPVDLLVDVAAVYPRKEAALRCYRTALETVDYVRAAAGLAAYRSAAAGLGGRGLAEGFLRLTAREHAQLCRRAGLLDGHGQRR